jgi:hypothetical protein
VNKLRDWFSSGAQIIFSDCKVVSECVFAWNEKDTEGCSWLTICIAHRYHLWFSYKIKLPA